jgi:rod shape determining protein RodA
LSYLKAFIVFQPFRRTGYFYHLFQRIMQLPIGFLLVIGILACIGFLFMYSAASGNMTTWANRQILHFFMFLPIMIIIAITDIRLWFRQAYVLYGLCILLLIFVALQGHTAMGATRWINLGVIKLQPSELAKIVLVLALARYFHSLSPANVGSITFLLPPLGMILLPFLLILKQPDLGTALTLLMVGGAMFWLAGVRLWKFVAVLIVAVAAFPLIWFSGKLHDYQKSRIITFLDPEHDPLGAGYNIIQSKIAIGSGGIFGKGLLKGSQSQLSFLPEHQTDFIFTMFAEEAGLVGAMVLLALYCVVMAYGWLIAARCRNYFGKLVAMGLTTLFFLHVFINMAMVMGMIPVVGAPLPLLSYGGTIMMATLIGFGFIMNSYTNRFVTLPNH